MSLLLSGEEDFKLGVVMGFPGDTKVGVVTDFPGDNKVGVVTGFPGDTKVGVVTGFPGLLGESDVGMGFSCSIESSSRIGSCKSP